jgi:lysophospholipase L1-like esterase
MNVSSSMKKLLEKLGLVLAGLFLALIAMEILSRVFWERISGLPHKGPISFVTPDDYRNIPPDQFVWAGSVGAIKEFHNVSSRNRLGFHDRDYAFEKPEGMFRIVVIGDSFVEAKEVPIPKNFTKILELKLNAVLTFPVEVIALGRSGNGTVKNLNVLEDIGVRFRPDLVIMQFLSNDPIDDDPHWNAEQKRQNAVRREYVGELSDLYPRYLLLGPSRFNQILALKTARLVQGIQTRKHADRDPHQFIHANMLIFTQEYSGQWKNAWDISQRHILQARNTALENGSEFLLVSFPEFWRVGDEKSRRRWIETMGPEARNYDWDFDKTDRRLAIFCEKVGIPFLSLIEGFRREYAETGKSLHFTYDMHLNERGHELAASIIAAWLQDNKNFNNVPFSPN